MRHPSLLVLGLAVAVSWSASPPARAASGRGNPIVQKPAHADVSPPLREILPVAPRGARHEAHKPIPFHPSHVTDLPDPVLQAAPGGAAPVTPGIGFAGVGEGDYGFSPDAAPPDTNGSVGRTHYVQWVNESFAVFDKSGNLLYGPAAGNTLWSGFTGGGCATNNDGDPIVMYDKAADRWIFTQFSLGGGPPFYQCVAVSQTGDPLGPYARYAYSFGNDLNDYPKLGVWPDGYYMTYNLFLRQGGTYTFDGGAACAMDRAKMLAGDLSAAQVCFVVPNDGGFLPADLDGATAPPAGSPNYVLSFGTNSLNVYELHADFATPSNSSLTGPSVIPVAAFSEACGGGTCVPQLGTRQQLDSLGDRLMYRLAYRNFGTHEALVVNHSVKTGASGRNRNQTGVRWYEVRVNAGTPSLFQQGTFAPDSSYRWMGSAAMDKAGNIAVGYSVSSSSLNPGIRFAARAPTDPLGTLGAETEMKAGTGSQLRNLNRWGDYSSLSVDPTDDCTLWFTSEYLKVDGTFNWSTWIGSFKIAGCN